MLYYDLPENMREGDIGSVTVADVDDLAFSANAVSHWLITCTVVHDELDETRSIA